MITYFITLFVGEYLNFLYYLFVEEKDDGGVTEPFVVADAVEQLQTLLHSVLKRGKSMKGNLEVC